MISLQNLGRSFQMGDVSVPALRNATLDIYAGEFLTMVGPSGSGKSTLLNLLGGLDQPTSGQLRFQERDLTSASPRELTAYRRDDVGFVFQFYNLIPNLTARENVVLAAELSQHPLDTDEVLQRVGLSERRDHFPAQLSGGEQQRVAIARAVVKNPKLLLCDEPTGALDHKTSIPVLQMLVEMNRDPGMTVIVITHNLVIADVGHRVVRLRSGEICEVSTNTRRRKPEEIEW